MSLRLVSLGLVLLLFGALTAAALMDVGYMGILRPHFESFGAGQVLADLVIACTLACFWMVHDARSRGTNPWPFVVITLVAGSFGPLTYLVSRELRGRSGSPSR